MDPNVQVKTSDERLQYQWWFEDEEIEEDDERYKSNDSGALSIHEFEKDYEGKYKLVVSTFSEPVMSVSTEVQLKLTGKIALNQWVAYCNTYKFFLVTDPPEKFDPKMKRNKFPLFLNSNGISYEVCKLLKGERLMNKC